MRRSADLPIADFRLRSADLILTHDDFCFWLTHTYVEIRVGKRQSAFRILKSAISGPLRTLSLSTKAELNRPHKSGTTQTMKQSAAVPIWSLAAPHHRRIQPDMSTCV